MKHNQGNQKSVYTKRQIAGALLTLLEEKDYAKITVSELCLRAECSRPSFYRNFDSVNDVFEFSVCHKINIYMENRMAFGEDSALNGSIDRKILNLWSRDREFVGLIVRRGLLNDFIVIVCRYLNDILREQSAGEANFEKITQYKSALQAYYTGAVLYVWADRGLIDTPEEILDVLCAIRSEAYDNKGHV